MSRAWGFLLGLSIFLLSTGRALAEAEAAPPPQYQPQYLDYRYQLVASDVAALGLVVAAVGVDGNTPTTAFALASLGTYALVPPALHLLNEQPMRGLASFGARVGFPVAGFGLGLVAAAPLCASDRGSGWGCFGAILVLGGSGILLGGLTAMVVDDAILGKVELPRDTAPPSATRSSFRASVLPLADPKRKALGLSLAGIF